jgi:hypothetical protein
MSVLERHHRTPGSATTSPPPDGPLVFPALPTARSGLDGGGWPWSRDPAVAATAWLAMAGQDSSPIQRAGRLATRVSALHRVGRWVSPSHPVESEQVSRWETDGGRTRELT